ncbi:hypothetical protein FFK22_017365 [Mycobacterium sp. KBS0706]|uniref:hypothetical protein n=1 Tax=Mycobacterium sp. KBS0706 TaxID=2578109 RepID=UPI00110F9973|nr:hypothetical protein [Mycobacterium sp. KBS0706]TSD87441.1 hypothetical protein FFK22_017365 [Mycobacterium sp. KBS0706]
MGAEISMGNWSEAVFSQFLEQGGWSGAADDNITKEVLSADLVKAIITNYRDKPTELWARTDLGLFALAMGVAEWGIADPSGLPPDPADKGWASDAGEDSGKHLMSYAIGGVGISHADVGDLQKFMRYVADSGLVPQEHRADLLRLADDVQYRKPGVVYDELRAAGVCAAEKFQTDLSGEPFDHFDVPPKKSYCTKYANSALQARDWRIFRTWMRAALRTRTAQEWLVGLWMRDYWYKSLDRVPEGDGWIEEALVNVRVRNSARAVANKAVTRPASTPTERVQRELDAYGEWKPSTLLRRCRIMLRPVVLYRHFAGEQPLKGVLCPKA